MSDRRVFVIVFACAVLMAALIALFGYMVQQMSIDYCKASWRDSGFESRYNLGCQIKVGGHWIPARAYRQTP